MNLEDEQRLKAHKRRLESGELDGPCNQRKRKRLMMKIAKLKKKCAADNLSTSAPKKNKLNRKQRKVKTLHLNKMCTQTLLVHEYLHQKNGILKGRPSEGFHYKIQIKESIYPMGMYPAESVLLDLATRLA